MPVRGGHGDAGSVSRMLPRVAVALVLVGVLSQVFLPRLAESRLRSSIAENAEGVHVDLSAVPAIKLLFHRADSVEVDVDRAHPGTGRLADLIASTAGTDRLDATVDRLDELGLELQRLSLRKRGDRLYGSASTTSAAVRDALPDFVTIAPESGNGDGVLFRGEASAFGHSGSVGMRVRARDGGLAISPDIPLGGFASVTIFADPRIEIDNVTSHVSGGTYRFDVTGRLR